MDSSGVITGWNHNAEQLFGWPPAEVIGRRLEEVVIPERYREAHRQGLARYLVSGVGKVLDKPIDISALTSTGEEITIELSITALPDGSDTTFVGFIRDLSQQHRLAAALWDNEARLASIIENLPGVAYITEVDGEGLYVSPQIEEILGYRPEEWLADNGLWERLLHPDDRERATAELRHDDQRGTSYSSIYRITARDGREVWIRDRAVSKRGSNGRLTVHGVMFDITRERGAEVQLELAIAEQATTADSLRRLEPGQPIEVTARAICRELHRIADLDIAIVYAFGAGGSVSPIAQRVPSGAPTSPGTALPADVARYLRESATGPWIDDLGRDMPAGDHLRAWRDAGATCVAYIPIAVGGETQALLCAGTTSSIGTAGVARWLPSLTQFAAIGAALLGPALDARAAVAGARAEILRVVDERDLAPVFQPIVRLRDASVIGYEALTRFADGTPPERRFAEAEEAGVGLELEHAAIAAALDASATLPRSAFVSLNVSHDHLDTDLIRRALRRRRGARRRIVVEITERAAIHDYDAVRGSIDRLPQPIDVAVDDAGAGFASLRHILELAPQYVKLDMHLVRGIDADPARQALVAGMVHFAHQLGCLLIAEGIETAAEAATLRRLRVPCGQGYLYGRPAPAAAFTRPSGTPVSAGSPVSLTERRAAR